MAGNAGDCSISSRFFGLRPCQDASSNEMNSATNALLTALEVYL